MSRLQQLARRGYVLDDGMLIDPADGLAVPIWDAWELLEADEPVECPTDPALWPKWCDEFRWVPTDPDEDLVDPSVEDLEWLATGHESGPSDEDLAMMWLESQWADRLEMMHGD